MEGDQVDGAGREGRDRFRLLFAEHSRPILGYALRRSPNAEDASDVVAETFLTAWRRLEVIPQDGEARLWLYGVARRVLANQRRGELRRTNLSQRLRHQLTIVDLAPDETGVDPDTAEAVRSAVATLPVNDREVLWLAAWEGLAPSEIGIVLGVPASTARTRLHRARARLRAVLEAADGEVERNDDSGHVGTGGCALARDQRSQA